MKTEELLLFGAAAYFLTRPTAANAGTTPPGGGGGGSDPDGPQPGDALKAPKAKRSAGGPRRKKTSAGALVPTNSPTGDEANSRIAAMKKRAYQKAAQDWIAAFIRAGASQEEAEGLARWAGLESSGNPYAQSVIGERGLLQCTKTTAGMAGGPFTPAEWAALASKSTDRETHAKLAIKQFRWHCKKAKVAAGAPARDRLWYAKVHHQRPADLRVSSARPDAVTAANLAAANIKGPKEAIRLAAANMVAFGETAPPAL